MGPKEQFDTVLRVQNSDGTWVECVTIPDVTPLIDDVGELLTPDAIRYFTTPDSLSVSLTVKHSKWNCKSRKRLHKLLMSIGYSRTKAIVTARLFVDYCGMSCQNAWNLCYTQHLCS